MKVDCNLYMKYVCIVRLFVVFTYSKSLFTDYELNVIGETFTIVSLIGDELYDYLCGTRNRRHSMILRLPEVSACYLLKVFCFLL